MKYFVFFVTLQLCCTTLSAQIIRLKTQAEVDNFSPFYAQQLVIGPDICCSDIHDLSPLSNIWGTEIGITIQNNPLLQSLHGLEQLNYMQEGGQIKIINNDSLPNLTGLADSISYFPSLSPKMVGYVIKDNDRLVDLQGLSDCSEAALEIRHNAALTSLNGCQHLNYLYTVTIENCSNLENLHGLEGVDTLFSSLFLQYCPRLKNMQGLNNCRQIGFQIYCHRLDSLETTDGLGNLRSTNYITFDSCSRFQALTDLERLGKNRFGEVLEDLEISYCPWFGSFSGLSDTAWFRKAYFYHVDSIEIVKDFQKLHANMSAIGPAFKLKYLDALPWGFTLYGQAPSFGAGSCPNLAYVRDTLPGRVDTMYNFGFGLCPKLVDITGFRYVKGVTNQMALNNFAQDSLIGLENLKFCNWAFLQYDSFKDLKFLRGLDSVAANLSINNYAGSLNGLEHLRTSYNLNMYVNYNLQNLAPIQDSLRLKSGFTFSSLTNLDSITGFNLPHLLAQNSAGDQIIRIEYCTNLKSINGFQGIASLPHTATAQAYDNIAIVNNLALQKITGFQNLVYLKKGLNISNNPSLTDLSGFCNLFQHGTIAGIKTIHDNAPGANSYAEALALCNASGSLEPDSRTTIVVYPNPASTEFMVYFTGEEISGTSNIVVCDLAGRIQLITKASPGQTMISCSRLPPGMYYVQVLGDGMKSRPVKLVVAAR